MKKASQLTGFFIIGLLQQGTVQSPLGKASGLA
jgi:hypothetical protein